MPNKQFWKAMPRFVQKKSVPYNTSTVTFDDGSHLYMRFEKESDLTTFLDNGNKMTSHNKFHYQTRDELARNSEQKITDKTKSIWYPFRSHFGNIKHRWYTTEVVKPKYPVYIVSKGRHLTGLTTKALAVMGIEHYIVVELSEYDDYNDNRNDYAAILPLPQSYLDNYETCDELGAEKSRGPGAARNYCHDHSVMIGHDKHWVMDDNIDHFHRLTDNEKLMCRSGAALKATEDFVDRFSNVPVAGLNYEKFCKKTDPVPPYVCNTRIYSCLLLENNSGYKWRGRYNEDTDLSLRVLKDGKCTIQMNAFLCGKVTTQRLRGGNSGEFYDEEGTLPKSQMLADLHPDVASVVWKFNRWHHHVDYTPFKNNRLILKDPSMEYAGENEYGLYKVEIGQE